jgi:tRNA threonylcarbamoyladenosine biosynthesis protein TsaB
LIILGIDTASAACSVAIANETTIVSEQSLLIPQIHSEKLVPLINDTLQTARLDFHELDGIAVSIGPGSFTGLRIGLSVAKGLAFSAGMPLVSVGTLEAIAYDLFWRNKIGDAENILSLIDARRDEVYAAMYKTTPAGILEVIPAAAYSITQILEISSKWEKIYVVGDGTEKFKKYVEKVESEQSSAYIIPSAGLNSTSASAVALIGLEKLKRGINENISTLEPLYLKEFYTIVQQPKVKL